MPYETRLALCLLSELVGALRANDPDTFKQRWLMESKSWENPVSQN